MTIGRPAPLRESGLAPGVFRGVRAGLAVVFFTNGSLFGSWAARIPAVKDHVGAGTGELGVALLGIAVGALLSKQVAGQLVARLGSGPVTRFGALLSCSALLLPALAGSPLTLGVALLGFGAAMGVLDVGMNAHAVTVEGRSGRPVLSLMHASYSIGGLVGALAGGQAASAGAGTLTHFACVTAATLALTVTVFPRLLPATVDRGPREGTGHRWVGLPRGRRLPLLLLAFIGLCGMAGEGASADWSGVYLHEDLGQSAAFASLGYACYSVAMAAGRLVGNSAIERWGGLRVVLSTLIPAALVFALALGIGHPVLALAGFTCLGVGLCVVMPVVFSLAGRLAGEQVGPAITLVSSIAGTGFLAGPPLIGFLAKGLGLPMALGAVSALALAAAALMYALMKAEPTLHD